MNNEVNCLVQGYISLPIEARSIFRLLDIGTVVRNPQLIKYLANPDHFATILTEIKQTPRLDSKGDFLNYNSKGHMGGERDDFEDCGEEELCKSKKAFFTRSFKDSIGTVFDYQVSLSSSQKIGEGVIDLLSSKDNVIYVIEAKKWESDEHPLRAIFEALTFWRMLADNGTQFPATGSLFVSRYNESNSKKWFQKIPDINLTNKTTLTPAILVRGKRNEEGSGIYGQLMNQQIDELHKSLYKEILTKTGLRCFRYYKYKEINDNQEKLQVEDFTEEFKKRIGCPPEHNDTNA